MTTPEDERMEEQARLRGDRPIPPDDDDRMSPHLTGGGKCKPDYDADPSYGSWFVKDDPHMTTPEEAALLPCPFCTGTAYVADDYGSSFCVKCNNPVCGAAVRLWATRDKAIAAWNRRALPAAEARIRVLEEALRGVIRVADRKTVEFDAAHDALAKEETPT